MQDKRKEPTDRTKYVVWGAAGGRCTLCNSSVLENENLGEPVPIGELAHNVGATGSAGSPRGERKLSRDDRAEPENLLLLCRNCHKPVDDGGAIGRYTVEQLRKKKREHEQRVYELTEIGADRKATVLRVVGSIRGVTPELARDTVLTAATATGLFPQRLAGAHWNLVEADLRHHVGENDGAYFQRVTPEIDELAQRVHAGVRSDEITRLAVFAIARIPLLVYLGAQLDDKVPTIIFQRHRVDEGNAWVWPGEDGKVPDFDVELLQEGTDVRNVAVTLNLSGAIGRAELPAFIDKTFTIYSLSSSELGPSAISSLAALRAFESVLRSLLARIEGRTKPVALSVFAAIPVAAAVTLGRVLMPNVSPALHLYDRDKDGKFFFALEIKR